MSLGFIRLNGFAAPAIPPLSKGTPSITIRGSLLAFIEVPPLILMVLPDPGAPLLEFILTPGTLPINNCSGVVTDPLLKSSLFIIAADPVISFVLAVPYPITTASFSNNTSSNNVKSLSKSVFIEIVSVTFLKPTAENVTE